MDSNKGYNFNQKIFQDDELINNDGEFNQSMENDDYILSPSKGNGD